MKKFISFLTALCFSAVFLSVNFPAGENMAAFAEEENNWRTLYGEVLENAMNSDKYSKSMSMFDLFDINGDNIPELFISMDNTVRAYGCTVYTIYNGEAVDCTENCNITDNGVTSEGIGSFGKIKFNPHKNVMLDEFTQAEFSRYQIMYLEGSGINEMLYMTQSVYSDESDNTFDINREKSSFDDYAAALAGYDLKIRNTNNYYFMDYSNHAYIEIGRKYKLTSDVIDSVMNERGWKSAYANIVRNTDRKYFSLCYIDNDDIPELVLHSSTGISYHSDKDTELYTYRNNEVVDWGNFSNDGYNNFTYYRDCQGVIVTGYMNKGYTSGEIYRLIDGLIYCDHTCSLDMNGGENIVDDVSYKNYSAGWEYFSQLLNFDEYINDYGEYEINEENIRKYLSEDETDPDVQAHLDWLEENPDIFKNYSNIPYLEKIKEFLLKNKEINYYKGLQNFKASLPFSTDNGASDYSKETVHLLIAFFEGINNYSQKKIDDTRLEILMAFRQLGSDAFAGYGLSIDLYKKTDEIYKLVNSGKKYSDVYLQKIASAWEDLEKADMAAGTIGLLLDTVGITLNNINKIKTTDEDYMDYVNFAIIYQSEKESMEKALLFFKSALFEAYEKCDDKEFYADLVYEFSKVYDRITADSDTLSHYYECDKYNIIGDAIYDEAKVIEKYLIQIEVALICPELAMTWTAIEVGTSLLQQMWEANSNIKEEAMLRDISLNFIFFYNAINNSMNTDFKTNLENNKDVEALCVFETGMEMYHKINLIMINYFNTYIAYITLDVENAYKARIKDDDLLGAYMGTKYRCDSLQELYNVYVAKDFWSRRTKDFYYEYEAEDMYYSVIDYLNTISSCVRLIEKQTSEIQCCDKIFKDSIPISILENEKYNISVVACPVNITVLNGTETAAKIENDKLVMTDNTCNIEIISEDENKSAAKVITYPAGYELKITGYGTGTMSISKITVSSGEISDSYIAENIPVEEGYSYSETKENDVTKIGIDYDSDEIYDEYIDLQTDSEEYKASDVNGDGRTDASDASEVLRIYAAYSTKGASDLTEEKFKAADVNNDGKVNASDASTILAYYAYISTSKGISP